MAVTDSSAPAANTAARTERWYDAPGHLMCCVCFEQVAIDEVYVCEHGQKWDLCARDGKREGCIGCDCSCGYKSGSFACKIRHISINTGWAKSAND